jgi:hypothetical protein
MQSFRKNAMARAEFDLNCVAEQIDATILAWPSNGAWSAVCTGAQVGVRGCGRQAVYVCERFEVWRLEPSASREN